MITCRRHIALIALCLAESCASGARQPEAPPTAVAPARVGIVIDDSGRTRLQESFANAVVSHLEALATSGNLQVIPRRDIDASLMTEIPPRWEGNDAREVGKLLRAIVM